MHRCFHIYIHICIHTRTHRVIAWLLVIVFVSTSVCSVYQSVDMYVHMQEIHIQSEHAWTLELRWAAELRNCVFGALEYRSIESTQLGDKIGARIVRIISLKTLFHLFRPYIRQPYEVRILGNADLLPRRAVKPNWGGTIGHGGEWVVRVGVGREGLCLNEWFCLHSLLSAVVVFCGTDIPSVTELRCAVCLRRPSENLQSLG